MLPPTSTCCAGSPGVREPRYKKRSPVRQPLNVVRQLKICLFFFLTEISLGNNIELSLRKEVVQEHE